MGYLFIVALQPQEPEPSPRFHIPPRIHSNCWDNSVLTPTLINNNEMAGRLCEEGRIGQRLISWWTTSLQRFSTKNPILSSQPRRSIIYFFIRVAKHGVICTELRGFFLHKVGLYHYCTATILGILIWKHYTLPIGFSFLLWQKMSQITFYSLTCMHPWIGSTIFESWGLTAK